MVVLFQILNHFLSILSSLIGDWCLTIFPSCIADHEVGENLENEQTREGSGHREEIGGCVHILDTVCLRHL